MFIFYFVRLPLCNKYSDYIVTFISIYSVIIYVVSFGACMRCTRLCSLKPGVTSVLDAVLESVKTPPPTSAKASGGKIDDTKEMVTASTSSAHVEVGPSKTAPKNLVEESLLEKPLAPALEAPSKSDLNFIVRHAFGKQLSAEQVAETGHYAKELKYPEGSSVYRGDNDDDFLYCLPDGKEINVCRVMMDNMGYPKLELGFIYDD
jgi:hypothetical protein